MYREIDDPWGQRENDKNDILLETALFLLKKYSERSKISVNQVLDIGCADGYHEKRFMNLYPEAIITGVDISETVINIAANKYKNEKRVVFQSNDIREYYSKFSNKFDIIYSSKTLYYVAPEIDEVLNNIGSYIKPNGVFCFIYNQTSDAFTNQWLTYEGLRAKLLGRGYSEHAFIEFGRFGDESTAIGIFTYNKNETGK